MDQRRTYRGTTVKKVCREKAAIGAAEKGVDVGKKGRFAPPSDWRTIPGELE